MWANLAREAAASCATDSVPLGRARPMRTRANGGDAVSTVNVRSGFSRRQFLGEATTVGLGALGAAVAGCATLYAPPPTAAPAAKPAEPAKPAAAAPTAAPAAAAKKGTEIRYGTFWAGYRVDVINPVLAEWAKTSNITVTVESVPSDRYTEKSLTQVAGGNMWDVYLTESYLSPRLYDQGQALDMNSFAQRDGIDVKKGYGLMGVELWDGKLFAMPFVLSPIAYYYNQSMLKAAGQKDPWADFKGDMTWDDVLEMYLKVSDQSKKPPTYGLTFDYTDIHQRMSNFIYTFGGKTHDYETMKYTLTDPKTIQAVQYVFDLVHKHKVLIPVSESQQLGQTGVANTFQAQLCAMEMETTGRLTTNIDTIKDKFVWDVMPIPKVKGGGDRVTYVSGNPNNGYSKSKTQEETWQTLKFLSGPVMQDVLSKKKLLQPALVSAALDKEGFLKAPPAHVDTFVKTFDGKVARRFFHLASSECFDVIKKYLEKIFLKELSVEEGLKKANDEANALVKFTSKPSITA
jgi:multiple sugar transport system substrate-binding protein